MSRGIWVDYVQALDAFLAGDDLPAKKPDPSIYVLAAERMGVQPEHCLVIEDSAIGLQVSQSIWSLDQPGHTT